MARPGDFAAVEVNDDVDGVIGGDVVAHLSLGTLFRRTLFLVS